MSLFQQLKHFKASYHLYSIWLFTYSDLKTTVGPKSTFGIIGALCASSFNISPVKPPASIIQRAPLVVLWTWSNLLPFAIDNQRQPAAIDEDGINKPWRPIPSKRLSPRHAKQLMLACYTMVIGISLLVGGFKQCVALVALGHWYNDLKGADSNCIVRNFINACGFVCYSAGAMEVALGFPLPAQSGLVAWFVFIGLVVFTTVQTQDIYDQAGDAIRGRKTVPLVIGDGSSRWSVAAPMVIWCWLVPLFWDSSIQGYTAPVIIGLTVVYRTLTKRSVDDDKVTFRLWNLWLVTLYCLPLLKH